MSDTTGGNTDDLIQRMQEMQNKKHSERCPNCGYCPHCGRSNAPPVTPWYPAPYIPWWTPTYPITWTLTSNTMGNDAIIGYST